MGCGCKKKLTGTIHFMGRDGKQISDPEEWGPTLWKYLHCLIEKIGLSGNPIMDTDQATYVEYIFQHLHSIIPCTECQEHARQYIAQNPVPTLKGLYSDNLRSTIRVWLFNFHNAVRSRKGQEIIVSTPEMCRHIYEGCFIPQCEFTNLTQSIAFGVRQGWIKIDMWKKWYNFSERLRVLSDNTIVR
jgi:hypothetical protein